MLSTRSDSETVARIGSSDGENASSVAENSVTCTGTIRFAPQTKMTNGLSAGAISNTPDEASRFAVFSASAVGFTSPSRMARSGPIPASTVAAF